MCGMLQALTQMYSVLQLRHWEIVRIGFSCGVHYACRSTAVGMLHIPMYGADSSLRL
jgi:hypothetical protein